VVEMRHLFSGQASELLSGPRFSYMLRDGSGEKVADHHPSLCAKKVFWRLHTTVQCGLFEAIASIGYTVGGANMTKQVLIQGELYMQGV